MPMKKINFSKAEKLAEELRVELKKDNLSQTEFSNSYYREVLSINDPEPNDLDKHQERFKKLLNKPDCRSPEKIGSYHNFFFRHYRANSMYSHADKQAAWDMFVELDTSIATRELKRGNTKSALSNIASLFASHRQIVRKYGVNCRNYYEIVNKVFEQKLRHFTSKWHGQLDSFEATPENEQYCRTELKHIQKELTNLKNVLDYISK